MLTTVQTKADIDNLGIISFNDKYYIVSEWSIHPIESYYTMSKAIDFIRGFKDLPIGKKSKEYYHGQLMKEFIRLDEMDYIKIQDIDSKYGTMIKIS